MNKRFPERNPDLDVRIFFRSLLPLFTSALERGKLFEAEARLLARLAQALAL
jgi:hypothetical protein